MARVTTKRGYERRQQGRTVKRKDREAEGWANRLEKGVIEIKRYACDNGSEVRIFWRVYKALNVVP